ncbi:MAG TPA: DUF488 domain-containing protein [Pirellulaceae bacterium]|nr:DUF488 domain-containing protein [Pirellulaceae bacterium]HMO93581.1 DUF488 domain-containing protein [Pirellulaceae bacterium]HMP71433.1 DUF488 domain-containing protein [Pirellulaceae bacterium]
MDTTIYTVGYRRWNTKNRMTKMIEALHAAEVTHLVDIRLFPCVYRHGFSKNAMPKDWHLQAQGGISDILEAAGIKYLWIPNLGNPEFHDPEMRVLRAHLTHWCRWPIQNGLTVLSTYVSNRDETVCLMCSCANENTCHRRLVAESLRDRQSMKRFNIHIEELKSQVARRV